MNIALTKTLLNSTIGVQLSNKSYLSSLSHISPSQYHTPISSSLSNYTFNITLSCLSYHTRWNSIVELVEQKKDQLDSMLRLQNYLLECVEIKSQIQDKRKAIDATQYLGSDLGGVLALQRRLSTMEGALSVLEPKLLHLQVSNYGKIH